MTVKRLFRSWDKKRLNKLLSSERGSFTLEASAVFPTLAVLIISFVIFGMYMYQKAVVYYSAASAAERTAFSWGNSHRDLATGMLLEPKYDGLYWRLGQDHMLSGLFRMDSDEGEAVIAFPYDYSRAENNGELAELVESKLATTARRLEAGAVYYEGTLSYNNELLQRAAVVKLKQPLANISISWKHEQIPAAMAQAMIVEPTEFIRSVDLIRYYAARLTGSQGEKEAEAGKVLASYQDAQ